MNKQTKDKRRDRLRMIESIRQAKERREQRKSFGADFIPPDKILKQANRELDLRHYNGSLADKMFELIRERNVELVKTTLDRLWRKAMNGEILVGKDFEAIEAAKQFLREVASRTS